MRLSLIPSAVLDSQGNIATRRAEAPGPGSELWEARRS